MYAHRHILIYARIILEGKKGRFYQCILLNTVLSKSEPLITLGYEDTYITAVAQI